MRWFAIVLVLMVGSAAHAETPRRPPPRAPAKPPTFDALANKRSEADVIKALGAPSSKGAPTEQPATGAWDSEWKWSSGVQITFTARRKTGPFKSESIRIQKPSALKTDHGQGIGSTRAAVEAAYKDQEAGPGSSDTRLVLEGRGETLTFTFAGGAVTEISRAPNNNGD